MCKELLSAILNCGYYDVEFLVSKLEEWNIDIEVLVDDESYNINSYLYEVFRLHAYDVKAEIRNFLEKVDNNLFLRALYINYEKLEDYEVGIYTNYLDSGYDDPYEFWEENLIEDIIEYKDFIKFLIEEEIVEVLDDEEEEEELLFLAIEKFKKDEL